MSACISVLLVMSNPMDCSPPDSSVHGISQARILEWVAISSFRRSSWPRDQTCVSFSPCINRWILHHGTTWEAPDVMSILHQVRDSRGNILSGKHWDSSLQRVEVKYFTLIMVRKQSFSESQIRVLRTPATKSLKIEISGSVTWTVPLLIMPKIQNSRCKSPCMRIPMWQLQMLGSNYNVQIYV